MRRTVLLVALVVGATATAAGAITAGQVDTFASGIDDWGSGGAGSNESISNPQQGGPDDGAFLQVTSDADGPLGRMVVLNRGQWTGDHSAAGVTAVTLDARNLGSVPLFLRFGLSDQTGPSGTKCVTDPAVPLPAGGDWTALTFDYAGLLQVGGTGTCDGVLAGVAEARVLSAQKADWQGDPVTATLGLDTISAVGGGGPVAPPGPIGTAISVSQERFADGATPPFVVLSRDDDFADSLAGSVLTADAPMLFTGTAALDPATAAEIDRLLGGAGEVLVLGGENAIPAGHVAALEAAGHTVVRLAGPSRFETAVQIAREAADRFVVPATVAVARAFGPADNPTAAWADSVAAGAWSAETLSPILLTGSDSLHPATRAFLDATPDVGRVILGGVTAVSEQAAAEMGPATRVAGPNRFATAVAVAEQLWAGPSGDFLVVAGNHVDGWAYGLAAAGLGADTDRPLLLVETDRLPAETDQATCASGTRADVRAVGAEVIGPAVLDALAQPCPPPAFAVT